MVGFSAFKKGCLLLDLWLLWLYERIIFLSPRNPFYFFAPRFSQITRHRSGLHCHHCLAAASNGVCCCKNCEFVLCLWNPSPKWSLLTARLLACCLVAGNWFSPLDPQSGFLLDLHRSVKIIFSFVKVPTLFSQNQHSWVTLYLLAFYWSTHLLLDFRRQFY